MFIERIKIANYRSIINLEIKIKNKNDFVCFCGQNNVGKTNILNALSLFFNKSEYFPEKDCPNHKYYWTRGGHYQPKIEIDLLDEEHKYTIIKNRNKKISNKESEKLYKISWTKKKLGEKGENKKMDEKEIEKKLEEINFFFLTSINVSFPEAIKYIMNNDVIDLETEQTRMSGKKWAMKKKIEEVLDDLKSILTLLSDNITPLLSNYKKGWGVAFDLPTEVNTFRDLMIWETDFYIEDKSNSKAIDAKGSWLQKLCHILIYFRIIEKLNEKKKKAIICIDEPDVYLHSWLQKKLLNDVKKKAKDNQIFITTHSPTFIDTIKLSNVFLLDQKIEEKKYQRAKRKNSSKQFNAIQTYLIDLDESSGISTLKNYLGITDKDNLLFDHYNVLVEGEEDKIYLSKLLQHFNLKIPNIIPCHWADNIPKHLDFYNSLSKENQKTKFLILLDNDHKWREVKDKIKPNNYKNLDIQTKFIIPFSGPPKINENSNLNIEIEDFVNPEIICYLCNEILKQKNLKEFKKKDIKKICEEIKKPAFKDNGILELLENKKNQLNPSQGQTIKINNNQGGFKSWISKIFNKLDKNIINLIGSAKEKENWHIVEFLKNISKARET